MAARRTQAERSRATRAALLASARALFTDRGYTGTSRDDIATGAGVTRGALYHHFDGKEGLFQAVVEESMKELKARLVAAAAGARGPVEALEAGVRAYLAACAEPGQLKVMLDVT